MSGIVPSHPRVAVVVAHRNTPERLRACIGAVVCAQVVGDVVVVDNGSRPDLVPNRDALAGARLVRNARNRGFAAACNQGASVAVPELLLFLNSDAVLSTSAVLALVAALDADPTLAAVAPLERTSSGAMLSPARRMLGPFGQAIGLSGVPHVRGARDPLSHAFVGVREAPWVRAAALLVRREVFRAVGGFDEGFFFYEEDEDLCWRLRRRGHRIGVCADAVVLHDGSGSAAAEGEWARLALYAGQLRFVRRRAGRAAALAYRASVSLVVIAKRVAGRSACPAPSLLLRMLWASSPPASTTGV